MGSLGYTGTPCQIWNKIKQPYQDNKQRQRILSFNISLCNSGSVFSSVYLQDFSSRTGHATQPGL